MEDDESEMYDSSDLEDESSEYSDIEESKDIVNDYQFSSRQLIKLEMSML